MKTEPNDLSRFEFDSQAHDYDARTRVGDEAARMIARCVASLGREALGLSSAPSILEIGAGTGEIGLWLAVEGRYVGIDASKNMLAGFEARLGSVERAPHAELHVADANERWPVREAAVDVVFFSRVLHLLDRRHVEAELARVAGPAGLVVLAGRTQRDRASKGAELRRMLWTALEDRGYSPRRGERRAEHFFEALALRGATRLPGRDAATIEVVRSPRARLEGWRNKGGLGGLDLPVDERARVLDEVEGWAARAWSDLDEPEHSLEVYRVEGAHLPPHGGATSPAADR